MNACHARYGYLNKQAINFLRVQIDEQAHSFVKALREIPHGLNHRLVITTSIKCTHCSDPLSYFGELLSLIESLEPSSPSDGQMAHRGSG